MKLMEEKPISKLYLYAAYIYLTLLLMFSTSLFLLFILTAPEEVKPDIIEAAKRGEYINDGK